MFYVWMWDLMGGEEPKTFSLLTRIFFGYSFYNKRLDNAFEMFFSEELN
jgi:hypothetical protein